MTEQPYAERINFLADEQIMEVDFSGMNFDLSKTVNDFYDAVDHRLAETGRKWFFLVNYHDCRIMTEAWIAFAHRGKKTNITYSLGSARYAASSETSEAILERSSNENFDPNLFRSRAAAVEHLHALRDAIPSGDFAKRLELDAVAVARPLSERIAFHPELQVMEVDFSDVTFENSADVHAFYDVIEQQLAATGQKWFFLVNYRDCAILPDAWIAFASRGKKVNVAHSLGSVRFAAREATGQSILDDAKKENFDPNLFGSRDAALEQIAALRRKAG